MVIDISSVSSTSASKFESLYNKIKYEKNCANCKMPKSIMKYKSKKLAFGLIFYKMQKFWLQIISRHWACLWSINYFSLYAIVIGLSASAPYKQKLEPKLELFFAKSSLVICQWKMKRGGKFFCRHFFGRKNLFR